MANILPINLLRTTAIDVSEGEWIFPRGTLVIPQISVLLNDPRVWENPKEFRPERFLDVNGKVRKIDEFIPFSIGKRQCLGESLARSQLFIIFSNVLSRLRIEADPSLDRSRTIGLTVSPRPYKLVFDRVLV